MAERYKEVDKCPICGQIVKFVTSRRSVGPEFLSPEGFHAAYVVDYVLCPVCGVQFQNPMPDMTGFYTSNAYRNSLNMKQEAMDIDEQARAKRIASLIISRDLTFDSMLDVGCSRGFLMNEINIRTGALVEGVEPNVRYVRSPLPTYISLDSIASGRYELITMIHVLEHVQDPVGFLKKAADKMSSASHILVEVPFAGSAVSPYRLVHLFAFDANSLRLAFAHAGLAVDSISVYPDLLVIGHKL